MQTEPTRTDTTTTSEPGLFETIIKYDHPTSMGTAFNDHLMESDAAGIDRHGRRMTICNHNADRTEWHLRTEPNAPDPADDFPCCSNGECHACAGKGYTEQQVYIGRPEPIKRAVCTNCAGTGKDA